MTHIKHDGIIHTFIIPMDDSHYSRFYIWDKEESMHAALPGEPDYIGRCLGAIWVIDDKGGPHRCARRFGEVHLVVGHHGIEVVAHEIQHLMNYWVSFGRLSLEWHDEIIARTCGIIHKSFWNEYYGNETWMSLDTEIKSRKEIKDVSEKEISSVKNATHNP